MNLERAFTSALVTAALVVATVPAGAQDRAGTRQRGGGGASVGAPAARQGGGQRAVPRGAPQARQSGAQARQSGPAARQSAPQARPGGSQARQVGPRASARPQYSGPARGSQYGGQARAPRAYQSRPYQGPRAVPRPPYYSGVRPGYPARGSYYARPYYGRPYYYARPYPRPYYYTPYRPYYFPSPYYTFRPHLSIGFGLWLGNPVPYPYSYLGAYTPRVYGYAPGGAYDVQPGVPVHGGVSFDIQPSDADVFVDGEYVGPVGTFTPNTEPLTLTPGVHRIAVQRDGFRSMEWEVTIEPGQVIPYRGAMTRY